MANVQSGHHSFSVLFCFSEDKIYILLILGISDIIYFLWTHPTQTATGLIYIYLCVVLGLRMGWVQPRWLHQERERESEKPEFTMHFGLLVKLVVKCYTEERFPCISGFWSLPVFIKNMLLTQRERERENCDFIIPSEIISRLDYIVFDFTRAFGVDIGSFYSQPWPKRLY